MFLRNEMKFLIIFLILAAAASLGMAKEPTNAPSQSQTHNPESPTQTPELPTNKDDKPESPTDKPDALSTLSSTIPKLGALSKECQSALLSIITNPEFLQCVPIPALLPLLPVLTDPSVLPKLLKDPVHLLPPLLTPVFDGICAAPKCSDKGVAGALQAVNDGCKKDASVPLIEILTGVITFYSPIRDTICFKNEGKDYCVFETLKTVFSLPKPPFAITGTIIDNVAFADPKLICTPCNKAIINTIFNFLNTDTNHSVEFLEKLGVPKELLNFVKLGVVLKCGFQFLDGKVGEPGNTDIDDFEHQLSLGQDTPVPSGASNIKGISLMAMIGSLLVSTLMI